MACFLVGTGEAVVVTAVRKAVQKKEIEKGIIDKTGKQLVDPSKQGICMTRKLGWLCNMLWGGALLLCIEHIWHGEVVPWFPFLTAMNTPEEVPTMLFEMATTGVGMALLVTFVWLGAICVVDHVVKAAPKNTFAGEAA